VQYTGQLQLGLTHHRMSCRVAKTPSCLLSSWSKIRTSARKMDILTGLLRDFSQYLQAKPGQCPRLIHGCFIPHPIQFTVWHYVTWAPDNVRKYAMDKNRKEFGPENTVTHSYFYCITARYFHLVTWSRDSGYWLLVGRPMGRSSSTGRVKNFLFSTSSRPALGPS
jgi:hypothetical protein